jgi:hypothetical protein
MRSVHCIEQVGKQSTKTDLCRHGRNLLLIEELVLGTIKVSKRALAAAGAGGHWRRRLGFSHDVERKQKCSQVQSSGPLSNDNGRSHSEYSVTAQKRETLCI